MSRPATLSAESGTMPAMGWVVDFWKNNQSTLERAEQVYGVPPWLVVGIIGVETFYGQHTGNFRTLDALSTLTFDFPKEHPRATERQAFFAKELAQFLVLAYKEKISPSSIKGSYAGALGLPQFMPSSWAKFAVDFDGNGKIDLLNSPVDAIGSVANYYRQFGWREGEAVIVPVDVGDTVLDALLTAGIAPHTTVAEFRKRGIVPLEPAQDDALATLFMVQSEAGPRYWLGLNNFYVITRYNRSINYAMAVHELAVSLRRQRQATGVLP